MAAAMAFGTMGMVVRIASDSFNSSEDASATAIEVVLFVAVSAGFGAYAYARKEDSFYFAVLALAWIIVTTTLLGRALLEDRSGPGALLFIAIYVIGASTAAVKGIAYVGRSWRTGEGAP